jgi:hypothetical protein
MGDPFSQGTLQSPEGWLDDAIASARAAFDAGNELAALDVAYLCAGVRAIPAWAFEGLPKDAKRARHRAKKTGRHARALSYTKDMLSHLERYQAVLVARKREKLTWSQPRPAVNPMTGKRTGAEQNVWDRAVELLSYRDHAASVEDVRRSYKLVKSGLKAGRASDYWYPSSAELSALIRPDGDFGLVYFHDD